MGNLMTIQIFAVMQHRRSEEHTRVVFWNPYHGFMGNPVKLRRTTRSLQRVLV